MARTHARVSRSFQSTTARSFTALASEARTLAESTSYCCAPAHAERGRAKARARTRTRKLFQERSHVRRGLGQGDLGRLRVAAMLVLDHAFLQAALADHDAVRDAHQLLVGEQHSGAL